MHDSEYVACPCCGERMQFVRTGSRANQEVRCRHSNAKPCGLVVATGALRGSTQPFARKGDITIELAGRLFLLTPHVVA